MKSEIVERKIPSDSLTPISVYQALRKTGCCLLESASHQKGEGKTSYIGIEPIATFRAIGRSIEIERRGCCKTSVHGKIDDFEALCVGSPRALPGCPVPSDEPNPSRAHEKEGTRIASKGRFCRALEFCSGLST